MRSGLQFGRSKMEIPDSLIESMADGEWHDLNELSTTEGLRKVSMTKLVMTLDVLAEYDFIELSEVWKGNSLIPIKEARLTSDVHAFVRKIKWIERAEREHGIFKP